MNLRSSPTTTTGHLKVIPCRYPITSEGGNLVPYGGLMWEVGLGAAGRPRGPPKGPLWLASISSKAHTLPKGAKFRL